MTKKLVELYSRGFYDPTNARVCTEKIVGLDWTIYNCSLENTRPPFKRRPLDARAERARESRNVTAVPTIFLNGQNASTASRWSRFATHTRAQTARLSGARVAPARRPAHKPLPCEI